MFHRRHVSSAFVISNWNIIISCGSRKSYRLDMCTPPLNHVNTGLMLEGDSGEEVALWLLTSICTSAKREVEVALLILTVLTVKHRYIFTTKFPFFKLPL